MNCWNPPDHIEDPALHHDNQTKKKKKKDMKKGDSTLFSFASVSCHLWTYTFYLISPMKQSYRFQWEQIGKPLIKHLIKACTATAPRRISLGLLTHLHNAKGSVSTVWLKYCFLLLCGQRSLLIFPWVI